MSKAYTEADLADQLDSDLTWRLRELSDLKSAIGSSQLNARSVLLRSLVTMLYAHWEGHIRFCANKYFEHVTLRKHRYDQLEKQLYINSFITRLDALHLRRVSVDERCQLISEVLESSQNRFSRINPSLIDTRSNLNTDVLKDLCLICGVDFSYFEIKTTFIDVILLKRRNSIAHGEETYIESGELDTLIAEVVGLMRAFKDAVQNKVYTKSYLRGVAA
jgi:hypothetical protein